LLKLFFLALADLTDWADFKNHFNPLICGFKNKKAQRIKPLRLCNFLPLNLKI
jgi:hypothetical protein